MSRVLCQELSIRVAISNPDSDPSKWAQLLPNNSFNSATWKSPGTDNATGLGFFPWVSLAPDTSTAPQPWLPVREMGSWQKTW